MVHTEQCSMPQCRLTQHALGRKAMVGKGDEVWNGLRRIDNECMSKGWIFLPCDLERRKGLIEEQVAKTWSREWAWRVCRKQRNRATAKSPYKGGNRLRRARHSLCCVCAHAHTEIPAPRHLIRLNELACSNGNPFSTFTGWEVIFLIIIPYCWPCI